MIGKEDFQALAAAAHFDLTEEEQETFTKKLQEIVKYMEKSLALDLDQEESFAFVHDKKNVLREDEVEPSFSQETVLANSPLSEAGQFLVPRII